MTPHRIMPLLPMLAAIFFYSPAVAYTGTTESPSAVTAAKGLLILVIPVENGLPHYEKKFTQAIVDAERSKSGVTYDVVSYVPINSDPAKNEVRDLNADNVLEDVVDKLESAGVDTARIHSDSEVSDNGREEIRIYTF